MDYRILGPLEVSSEGRPVNLGGPKPRLLLAILLAARGQSVSAAALAEDLWSGDPPASANSTLQAYISRLRAALPAGALVSEGGGYALRPAPGELDADRFEAATAAGRAAGARGDAVEAVRQLELAAKLWRSPALPELADSPAFRSEALRLDELRLSALEERFAFELEGGHHGRVVPELEAAVEQYPLREALRVQLMLALYRAGRQTEALRAYQQARAYLAESVGLDPGPELARLEAAILAQDPSLDAARAPELLVRPVPMPASLTGFVGRTAERADLAAFMAANRLVTLLGAGGAGKSRLALEVASDWGADRPADWVALVELVNIAERDAMGASICAAVGVAADGPGDLLDDVVAAIAASRGLLVLDNAEHLVEATGDIAERLLMACPELRVLTTSRTPLGIAGEAVWRVGGLSPSEAVSLFRARAGQAELPEDTRVEAACRRLDGLPLPIELAAARLRHLTFDELIAGLDDRLLSLEGEGLRDRVRHHRTVTAMVDWSLDLLDERDRQLMHLLSIFEGGFEPDAAERTAALSELAHPDVRLGLTRLVDHSLLELEASGRHRLLETVRAVSALGLEDSGRRAAVATAHLGWVSELAAEILDVSRDESTWVDRMRAEFPNLRAALVWALGGGDDAEAALRLATRAAGVLYLSGPMSEGRRWLESALARAEEGTFDYGRGLNYLAVLAWSQSEVAVAEQAARQSLDVFQRVGAGKWVAIGLNLLGDIARGTGRVAEATKLNRDALEAARPLDPDTVGTALINLACIHLDSGDSAEALPLLEEAAALLEEVERGPKWATALYNLASIHRLDGDLTRAEQRLVAADEIYRRIGDERGVGFVLHSRAKSAAAKCDHEAALGLLDEALAIGRERGDELFVVEVLLTRAKSQIASGALRPAEESLSEALAIERRCGSRMRTSEALRLMAQLSAESGSRFDAKAFAEQALSVARETGNPADITESSEALAGLALAG